MSWLYCERLSVPRWILFDIPFRGTGLIVVMVVAFENAGGRTKVSPDVTKTFSGKAGSEFIALLLLSTMTQSSASSSNVKKSFTTLALSRRNFLFLVINGLIVSGELAAP